MSDCRNAGFLETVSAVSGKIGRLLLDDSDLLILACEEISRTTTYEERNYAAGTQCSES